MAMTVTHHGADTLDIGNVPEWHVFDVAGELLEGSTPDTEEIALLTLPIGSIVYDATICCIVAGAGAGADVLSLKLDDGSTERLVVTGTADNGGAADVMDRTLVIDGSAFPTTVSTTLEALRSIDDDVDPAASYRVAVLVGRSHR